MNILFNQITFIVTSSQHSALVSEFLESVLQTVQKQFTYRLVLGGIPVHTEYRCLFLLRYEFLKYRNTGVI